MAVDGKYSGPIILPTITTAIIGLSDTNKHKTIPIVGLSYKKPGGNYIYRKRTFCLSSHVFIRGNLTPDDFQSGTKLQSLPLFHFLFYFFSSVSSSDQGDLKEEDTVFGAGRIWKFYVCMNTGKDSCEVDTSLTLSAVNY